MNIRFKITSALLATVRIDLRRPHPFAHERVGFVAAGLAAAQTVIAPGAMSASGSCPAGCNAMVGLRWWRRATPHEPQEIPMPKLTDTQLLILSAASQRDDRGVDLPENLQGEASRKAVDKLIRAKLLEKVRALGSLPVWQRDGEGGPLALRITKSGLKAIAVEDDGTAATKEPSIGNAADHQVEDRVPEGIVSRKRVCVAAQKSIGKKHRHGKAKTKTGTRRESQQDSKQARVIDMLRASGGTSIAMIMKATGWQQHSVRGFFAGVVRKKLGLNLNSEKVDGERIYRIVNPGGAHSASRRSSRHAANRLAASKR
jgi:hypothetical protein